MSDTPKPKTVSIEALCALEMECGELELKLATERARADKLEARCSELEAECQNHVEHIAPIKQRAEQAESKLADERTTSDYLAAAIQMQYPPDNAIARYNESLDKSKSTPAAPIVFRKLETAEAWLTDACFHLKCAGRLLLTAATDEDGADGDECLGQHRNIEAFLSSTTPPPILEELERLRDLEDQIPSYESHAKSTANMIIEAREKLASAEQERDAFSAQLQVAKEVLLAISKPSWTPPTTNGICDSCGAWTPPGNPEAHDHEDGCKALQRWKLEPSRQTVATEALAQLGGEKAHFDIAAKLNLPPDVEAYLHADRNLPPETAETLSKLIIASMRYATRANAEKETKP